jgi:epoxyqueuosine reductase
MAGARVSFSDHEKAADAAPSARARVLQAASDLGFDAVGVARADVPLDRDFERYEAFLDAGMHGDMDWLARWKEARERLDGDEILRGARSVVCVARRYQRPGPWGRAGPTDRPVEPGLVDSIARYARGRDYHRFLRRRLRRLATLLRSFGTPEQPVRARPLCDEEPILERAWAARAGLGFVGKNGLLIVPGAGSMVLLGEVVTTLDLGEGGSVMAERCGSCVRCLDACPTGAFARPFVLDARRCISYLTIEQRGPMPEELRAAVGAHLFGCDDCQTVCPFNVGAAARTPLAVGDGDPFAPLDRWSAVAVEALLGLDEAAWSALSEGTPLRRAGRAGIARNAAIVLGNRGDPRSLPALRAAARAHDDARVRDAASWAIAPISNHSASAT